ncbi:MAG: hypothetical protein AUF79_18225 [Crenarchaeota archaeon 13_1_20CM_2_51_8]|nr:MAG: hypothetical protein AUF79_18225 [Crenarchaeota archaeon 13_1_20CM_2_51_8]
MKLPGRPVSSSRKILWAGALAAFLALFSSAPVSLDGIDLLPVVHFVNVVSGLVLGPWYALGVAVVGGGIRMSLLGATLFVLPTALPGGVAVGLARKFLPLRLRWTAGFFELVGTMFGAGLSYALVAVGALSSRVPVSVFLGLFLLSSSIGTVLGFSLIWVVTSYRRRSLGSLRLKPMVPLTVLVLSVFLSTFPVQGVRGQSMGPPIVSADILGSGSRFGNTTAFLELAQYDYRNNTTFYVHPKSLYFIQSLVTRLSPELQCSGCPYYLTNAWISVSFTNSSGGNMYLQVSPITVFADPGGSAGYQNQSPSLKVSSGNLPWGEWINVQGDRRVTTETVGLGYTIPLGDLFKGTIVFTVTNHAEVWENLDSFLVRDAVGTSTYSFVYIVM